MPSVSRKWLPPVLIALAIAASAVVYPQLPAMVELRFEGLLPFPVTSSADPAPRSLAVSLMPALALMLWVAFRLAPTAAGQRVGRRLFRHAPEEATSPAQFERFSRTYEAIVFGVVLLVVGLHAAIIAAAMQAPGIAARIVPAVLGGSLVLLGNVTPRLRPNWVAGLRTKRLLQDPQLWRSTHRIFGAALVASGLITILAALIAPQYGLLVGIGLLLVSCVIGAVMSVRRTGSPPHAAVAAVALLCSAANGMSAQAPGGGVRPIELAAPPTVTESPYTFVRGGLTQVFRKHCAWSVGRAMDGGASS